MKRKITLLLALILILSMSTALVGCGGNDKDSSAADTVIKGVIYTADKDDTVVEAVAVKDGKYVYTGDNAGVEEYVGDDTEVIETGDGMAMPSFVEAHAHGSEGGVSSIYEVNMYEDTSLKDYQNTVKKFIEENPDRDFIKGAGWINGYFENNTPTAKMLDDVVSGRPVAIVSGDHHSYWVNTKMLELMKVDKDTKDIEGGVIERDSDGNPIGCFRENAQELVSAVIPDYTVDEWKKGILAYQDEVKAYGTTAYLEPMINLNGSENLLKAYNQLDEKKELTLKVFGGYQINDEEGYLEEVDKLDGLIKEAKGGNFNITSIKLLIDGVVEGHTAYLLDDYADEPGDKGEPLWNQDHLNELVAKADSMGIQVHTHAIGDAAVRMAVDSYEYTKEINGDTDLRHGITHLQVVNPDDIKRMGELNVVACTNPYWFCKEPGYYEEVEVPYLGKKRASKEYPMKDFFDAGCVVNVASDFPVTVPSMPLQAIQVGVTRTDARTGDKNSLLGEDQRVDVLQMLKAATYNGAYSYFAENDFGSIEKGKSADYIVLDKNIMEVDPFDISSAKILNTVLKGDSIYKPE